MDNYYEKTVLGGKPEFIGEVSNHAVRLPCDFLENSKGTI